MRVNETTVEGFEFDGNLAIADKDVSKIIDIVARDYKHDSTPIREAIINGIEAVEGIEDGLVTFEMTPHMGADQDGSPFMTTDGRRVTSATITISDNGTGMSPDEVEMYFTHVGWSSKDKDANATGGFGIGTRGVTALTDLAVWSTTKNGETTTFFLGRNDGKLSHKMDSVFTDKPNGTTLTFNVSGDRYENIREGIVEDYLGFADPATVRYILDGEESDEVGKYIEDSGRITDNLSIFRSQESRVTLIYNNAPYDITEAFPSRPGLQSDLYDLAATEFSRGLGGALDGLPLKLRVLKYVLPSRHIVIRANGDTWSFEPLANREGIRATGVALQEIESIVSEEAKKAAESLVDGLNRATTPAEWMRLYDELRQLSVIGDRNRIFISKADTHEAAPLYASDDEVKNANGWDTFSLASLQALESADVMEMPLWESSFIRSVEDLEFGRFGGIIGALRLEATDAMRSVGSVFDSVEDFTGFKADYVVVGFNSVPEAVYPDIVEDKTPASLAKFILQDTSSLTQIDDPRKYRSKIADKTRRATAPKVTKKNGNTSGYLNRLSQEKPGRYNASTLSVFLNDEVFDAKTNSIKDVVGAVAESGVKAVKVLSVEFNNASVNKINGYQSGEYDAVVSEGLQMENEMAVRAGSIKRALHLKKSIEKSCPKVDVEIISRDKEYRYSRAGEIAAGARLGARYAMRAMGITGIDVNIVEEFSRLSFSADQFRGMLDVFGTGEIDTEKYARALEKFNAFWDSRLDNFTRDPMYELASRLETSYSYSHGEPSEVMSKRSRDVISVPEFIAAKSATMVEAKDGNWNEWSDREKFHQSMLCYGRQFKA